MTDEEIRPFIGKPVRLDLGVSPEPCTPKTAELFYYQCRNYGVAANSSVIDVTFL